MHGMILYAVSDRVGSGRTTVVRHEEHDVVKVPPHAASLAVRVWARSRMDPLRNVSDSRGGAHAPTCASRAQRGGNVTESLGCGREGLTMGVPHEENTRWMPQWGIPVETWRTPGVHTWHEGVWGSPEDSPKT